MELIVPAIILLLLWYQQMVYNYCDSNMWKHVSFRNMTTWCLDELSGAFTLYKCFHQCSNFCKNVVPLNWTVIGVKKDSCRLPRWLEPKSWFCCSPWWPLLVVLCILAFPYTTDHSDFWCNIIHKIVVLIDWRTAINIFPYPIFFPQLLVPLWL